jgi:hypothetical protein
MTVLPYAGVAAARFEAFNTFTVRVLRRDAPAAFVNFFRDDPPGLLSGLLRPPPPPDVPGIWFTAAELADRLTELGSFVRGVLAVDPDTAPARRDLPVRPREARDLPPAPRHRAWRPVPRPRSPLPPEG